MKGIFRLHSQSSDKKRFLLLPIFTALIIMMRVTPFSMAQAATPASGTLAPSTGASVAWDGTGAGPTSPNGEDSCVEGVNCDAYTLTLSGTQGDWTGKRARVNITWLSPSTDYDMYIHKDSASGPIIGQSANGVTTSEAFDINPADTGVGVYVVHVVYFAATAADQYHGTATVIEPPSPPPPPPPGSEPPEFAVYRAPGSLGDDSGEPSIGLNWKSGNAMFIAGLETLRVTFNDTSSPAQTTWVNKPAPNTNITSFDPILFTDSKTGRTFASQLLPTKISLSAFTDDDGESYLISQGAGINSGVDHQTIGGGPFKRAIPGRMPTSAYPNAIYYASQDVGTAEIALSLDGGMTFGPAVPMWTLADCSGLHGHIKVAPDGTVYVPNKACAPLVGGSDGVQAVAVSENNGLTWSIRRVPGSTGGDSDPSVGIGAGGRVYFGYNNGDGHPRVAVSDDHGMTWKHDQDVGTAFGIKNSVFASVVAGDNDRAAFFFIGTPAAGAGTGDDSGTPFVGTWHTYIAVTYNGGESWITVKVEPNDPVQQGVICTNGTTCPSGTRNLLDFNDVTVDRRGRILAGYADGCITAQCVAGVDRDGDGRLTKADNDKAAKATIIRLSGGRGLFSAFDPAGPAAPGAPLAAGNRSNGTTNLTWSSPSNNGSPVILYKIYRGSVGNGEMLLTTVPGNINSFSDRLAVGGPFYYRVTAVNAYGESASAGKVIPR